MIRFPTLIVLFATLSVSTAEHSIGVTPQRACVADSEDTQPAPQCGGHPPEVVSLPEELGWKVTDAIRNRTLPPFNDRSQASDTVRGTVLDAESGLPIPGVRIRVMGRSLGAITDQAGRFALSGVTAGEAEIEIRHVRYGRQRVHVSFSGPDQEHVTVRLSSRAIELEGIHVRPERQGLSADYHRRSERGIGGTFITGDELRENFNFDLIEAITRSGAGIRYRGGIVLRRHVGRACRPDLYADGSRIMAAPMDYLHTIHPLSVEGIEIYQGGASIPGEFGGSTAQCGVIAVWLNRGT